MATLYAGNQVVGIDYGGTGDDDQTVWVSWVSTGTTATNLTITNTWGTWINEWETTNATAGSETALYVWGNWNANAVVKVQPYVDQRTPEQRAAEEARWQRERAENQRRADEALAAQKAATERARALLHSILTAEQSTTLREKNHFEVVAQKSGRTYRIHQGSHGNVRLIEKGKEVCSYCGQPNGIPTEDQMAAQALQLMYDEETYLRHANRRAM